MEMERWNDNKINKRWIMSKYLEALWENVCECYDCSREHITTKPNLVIAVHKKIKFYFWKIKEEMDNK